MLQDNTETRVIADVRRAAEAQSPGSRLPSVRDLMARHRASPVTVQRAIARLAAEGVVVPRPGRGTFVAERAQPRAAPDLGWQDVALAGRPPFPSGGLDQLLAIPPEGTIALASGYLDPELQPVTAAGQALARAARRPDAWGRLPVEGLEPLRAWFATQAGGGMRPHDVVIASGGQSALSTAFRALAGADDPIVVESPTYPGAIVAARAAGLRVVPVPADGEGIRTDLLADALALTGARVVYVQPAFANPHGATLSPKRRAALLDAVGAAGAFVIEDDWARDLAIDGPPPPPLSADDPDGHVVHLRSLTKIACPSLRVAAVCARGPAGARLRAARVIDDFFVAGPLQHAALEIVTSPAWRRHLRSLRGALRERRDALVAALAEHAPDVGPVAVPRGGLHLWVRLPDGTDDAALAARAAQAGVIVTAGRAWFAADPPGSFLRLTYAAAPPADLNEGVRRLASVLHR